MRNKRAKQLRKGVLDFLKSINANMKEFPSMYRRVKKNYSRGVK